MAEGIVQSAWESYRTVDPILRQIIVAVVILILGLVAGKLFGKLVKKVLDELGVDKAVKSATGWKFSVENFASGFVTYFTYFVAVIMALDTIGITSAVLNMVAGIIILLLLISVVLAIKDLVPNMMAGVALKNRKEYRKGARIKMKNLEGRIEEIGMLETRVVTPKKDTILIPNSLFLKRITMVKK